MLKLEFLVLQSTLLENKDPKFKNLKVEILVNANIAMRKSKMGPKVHVQNEMEHMFEIETKLITFIFFLPIVHLINSILLVIYYWD